MLFRSGLAMSSRNTYLIGEQREQAVVLNQALKLGKVAFENGESSVDKLIEVITNKINEMPLADIDYVSVYDFPTLEVINNVDKMALAAVAVRFGKTRLIDNIILERK